MKPEEQAHYEAIFSGTASDVDLINSLYVLSQHLHEVHGECVVLLIDEYDTPIHEAYANGYYDEVISFFLVCCRLR